MYVCVYVCIYKRFYLFIFTEREREGERQGGKHQCVVASHMPSTGDLAHSPSMCPGWESRQPPFHSQAGTQSTEPHQPGQLIFYLLILREEEKRDRQTDRHWFVVPLRIHWLILLCSLIRDQTHNLGTSGWCSNQLSYPARAETFFKIKFFLSHMLARKGSGSGGPLVCSAPGSALMTQAPQAPLQHG